MFRPLKALECPFLLQVGNDVHALQSDLPRTLLEYRVAIGVDVSKGPSQRLCGLSFPPECEWVFV